MSTAAQGTVQAAWHSRSAGDVATELGVDPDRGLDGEEVERRLSEYGRNELTKEPPPSVWDVARGQLSNPMNIMLMIVAVASFVDRADPDRASSSSRLVTFNVVMGSQPGAEGAGERRGARAAAGAACPRAPRRVAVEEMRVDDGWSGRHRAARGR